MSWFFVVVAARLAGVGDHDWNSNGDGGNHAFSIVKDVADLTHALVAVPESVLRAVGNGGRNNRFGVVNGLLRLRRRRVLRHGIRGRHRRHLSNRVRIGGRSGAGTYSGGS